MMEEQLKELGDPSGQQTSQYWDAWFSVVSSERSFFEWYCDANEVARVLQYHLVDDTKRSHDHNNTHCMRRMVHPGAGNSLVPLVFAKTFPRHEHVVVDISPVAVEILRKTCLERDDDDDIDDDGDSHHFKNRHVQFLVGDVLNPPLHSSLSPESFDAWIDKGLIDALFAKEGKDEKNQHQGEILFQEANRLLEPTVGIMLVVTLAEDHVLELILHNWNQISLSDSNNGCRTWSPCLHVWELVPISGNMRPFGFVLSKAVGKAESALSNKSLLFHRLTGELSTTTFDNVDSMTVTSMISTILEEARVRFQKERNPIKIDQFRLLATLEVKPCDDEVDLVALRQQITTSQQWRLAIQWLSWDDNESNKEETTFAKIVPMAYGISKMLLRCLVTSSEDLQDLVEEIQEWDAEHHDGGYIQSIDIDWDATHPVGNVSSVKP